MSIIQILILLFYLILLSLPQIVFVTNFNLTHLFPELNSSTWCMGPKSENRILQAQKSSSNQTKINKKKLKFDWQAMDYYKYSYHSKP